MERATQLRRSRGKAGRPKAESLSDRAYRLLRAEIISCALKPGTEIGEQELAARLNMSKTPVREALARLIQEGLAEAFPRRGYRVTPVTVKDVNDLFLVRSALETLATELAARNMSEADLDKLESRWNATCTPGEELTVDRFIAANDMFHLSIAEASGVPRLVTLVSNCLRESERIFHLGANARDVSAETQQDHARIIEALRARDLPRAREAVIRHTENTRKGLLNALIADSRSSLLL